MLSGGWVKPPTSGNVELLQNSVELSTDVVQSGGRIDVSVQVTNTNVGHNVPTDHPGRHLILTVNILDEYDQPLTQLSGPRVPTWGGEQAGMAGKTYAKILQDTASGKYPVVSYWKRTRLVSDNRIPSGESDSSNYTFLAPPGGETIRLIVELRFRRLFDEIQSAKGWETPDVIMEQASQSMVVSPWWVYYLPLASSH